MSKRVSLNSLNLTPITSPQNQVLKLIRNLHTQIGRQKHNLFLLEGVNCVSEALRQGFKLEIIIVSQSYFKDSADQAIVNLSNVSLVEDKIFANLTTTVNECGIMAVVQKFNFTLADCLLNLNKGPLLILDSVQDPGNLGNLIRTSTGFDVSGIILLKGCVDIYNPKVVRASTGSIFKVPFVCDVECGYLIDYLKQHNINICVLDAKARHTIYDTNVDFNRAVVLGNEGHGVNVALQAKASEIIKIPTNPSLESLNVTISAAIVLNHWWSVKNGFRK